MARAWKLAYSAKIGMGKLAPAGQNRAGSNKRLCSKMVDESADDSSDDKYDHGGGDSYNSQSASDSETSGSSSSFSEACNERPKRAKRRMKRKYDEDSCDSSDTCEPRKHKKRKIVKKKRKSKKKKKSRKATERLVNRKGREKDVIYTGLIRLDNNDSRIPVLFSLTSSCAASFAAFKDKVLEACDLASRKNVQFKYLYNDIRVQLCESTWVAFLHFVKSRTDYTVSLELETSLSRKVGVPIQPKEPGKGFRAAAVSSKSPCVSVLKSIVEKEWSSVYIHGLPKKSREEAMRELVTEQLRESHCKTCPISHTSKVAVAACPEELPGQLKKLLTACELRKFFDKRAKVRKVYGSADLFLNPLFVQCPICAAVVSLGHFNDIMIKRDNLWQHIKSSHVDDLVRSRYRGMLGNWNRFSKNNSPWPSCSKHD